MPTIDKTDQDIYTDLRKLLMTIVPCPVLQGYPENSPPPTEDFVYINILFKRDMSVQPITDYDPDNELAFVQKYKQVNVQFDFYGPRCEEYSSIFENIWNNFYSCDRLEKCQPLNIVNSTHSPVINETNTYEQRHVITASLQYNPVVTHQQDFTDTIEINILNTKGK